MAKVLIAGCGYVGSELAKQLLADGDEVWGLKRNPAGLPPGVRPVAADLTNLSSLAALPAPIDFLIYSAAADRSDEGAYRAAYVRGPETLVSAYPTPPTRTIYISSTSVYGECKGEEIDEKTAAIPARFNGRILLEGEKVFESQGWETVVLRLGGIYGPGRDRLIREVRDGRAEMPAGRAFTNRIHRDDAAGAIRHLMKVERPLPLYLGVDTDPADLGDVYCWIAGRLGSGEPPPSPSRTANRNPGKRCRSTRLVESGFRFRYPTFREGYESLLHG